MKIYCNGNQYDVPNRNGTTPASILWQTVGANPNRQQLVVHRPDGKNEILRPVGDLQLAPDSYITPIMLRERG
jgi:hypothetical protein